MEQPRLISERWRQVKQIFQAAIELAPAERPAYLTDACSNDPALRAEVESLLAAHEQPDSFMESRAGTVSILAEDQAGLAEERRVGSYKLIREIGHGGISAVYLGVRSDDEYQKRVAIKLLKRGMDTDPIVRRFRNERQILASLDHPNVARMLDGGTTEEGLPYFVMEYIEGKPIDDYRDTNKLNTVERLKLFRAVCSAVLYAHQNIVVHRDIKPGNILVTAEGVPRLLDFGIAKLLNPELSSHTVVPTATALRVMTPEYASPEDLQVSAERRRTC